MAYLLLRRLRIVVMLLLGSVYAAAAAGQAPPERTFGGDVRFLAEHTEVIVLGDDAGPQIVVAPAYQGRVMTSSATGSDGTSYGWINDEQVAAGVDPEAQINVFGGEERFWLGPEGGQYSIFFAPGARFEFAAWQTPPAIDQANYVVVDPDNNRSAPRDDARRGVDFRHEATFKNYSGTEFVVQIDRRIELLSPDEITQTLGVEAGDIAAVGYRTTNRLTNRGDNAWTKESGLLSIWLLGMYKHGPQTTAVIPFREGPVDELGPVVNDDYFGKVSSDRLKVADGVIYFKCDGQQRGKIGISPQRALPICGSYDATRGVLTIVKYNGPDQGTTDYVNSMWEIQEHPYQGDVVNAYNDGPPGPGLEPLGPFYELETSSPALALAPDASGVHIQETYHFEGHSDADRGRLDKLAQELLGVSLQQIEAAFAD